MLVAMSSSSSSGGVFFEKVGCHDPAWLPILSNSHEVFVSHSRPFCDVCQPLRSSYVRVSETLSSAMWNLFTKKMIEGEKTAISQ